MLRETLRTDYLNQGTRHALIRAELRPLLRAWAQIDRPAGARLILAGDGPQRAEAEALVAELGLEDSVDLLGWVDPGRGAGLLEGADVLVLPSFFEGQPLALIEGMARGVALHGGQGAMQMLRRLGGRGVALDRPLSPELLTSLQGFSGAVWWGDEDTGRAYARALAARTGPILPLIGAATVGVLWMNLEASSMTLGLVWAAIGLGYLAVLTRRFRQPPPQYQDAEAIQ